MPVADHAAYCEMLDRARKGRFAYPAINVTSLTTANAVLRGLAEARSDGIVQVSTGGAAFASGSAVKVPEVVPIIVESPEPSGPFGAKGVGEPALIPTAPAILNAIADALGTRIYALPANLELVLAASIAAGHFKPAA